MSYCPHCNSNRYVHSHGFHDRNFGRKVIGLKCNYFIILKRYICKWCQKESGELAESINTLKSNDRDASVEVQMKKELQYTHIGWNNTSVALMTCGWGMEFPAF